MKNEVTMPVEGLKGIKAHFKSDFISGFLVFLLALPLSLGIAKASGFPASMGVLTAMIGGLVSFLKVSPLTIKGPAAGLITICSGAIVAMGGSGADNGFMGWHLACGIIVFVGLIQVVLAYLKLGSYSEFFPTSAVHGMLAAIGLIIIAKQIPVLLGDAPELSKGLSPLELYTHIPEFVINENLTIAIVGLICLAIMFIKPMIKALDKIPAPMVVLIFVIPASLILNLKATQPEYILVHIGNFWKDVTINADFSQIATLSFWKYVLIFLFVNSLESLLTVKAIDGIDPYKRKSDFNGDLKAVGVGNSLAGLLGGLPMISEVLRSSVNTNNGAKTKWANLWHGVFLLIAMIFLIPVIELIPNAALASMLIYAGFKLAAPSTFSHAYKVGYDQFVVFILTVLITLVEDLLMGIAVGIIANMVFQLYYQTSFRNFFKFIGLIEEDNDTAKIKVDGSATFSNWIGMKKLIEKVADKTSLIIDFSSAKYVDHNVLENLHTMEHLYKLNDKKLLIEGLNQFKSISDHELSGKYRK
jgi:MFS superfamily sulfate permease-like transporter